MIQKSVLKWEDWPMVLILLVCYCGLIFLCAHFDSLPVWISIPLAACFICLFGSLQHEALHGHPTRSAKFNEMLVFLPWNLWVPYRRFREIHLQHHNNDDLTHPLRDPESFYLEPEAWAGAAPLTRCAFRFNNTLVGRLLIGPALIIAAFIGHELSLIRRGRRDIVVAWGLHVLGTAAVYVIVVQVCGMPFWAYVGFFVYPGLSLTLLRSYAEHRAHENARCRSVIIESGPLFSLLYMNNNLHAVHHQEPTIPWHRLPQRYRQKRTEYRRENCGYVMKGYLSLVAKYMISPKEPVAHPLMPEQTIKDGCTGS